MEIQETPEFTADKARREEIERLYQEREIKGFESDESRRRVEGLELERREKALKGELPIDQGLLKDLATRETETRDRLFRQLGEGYETSTPGIEALREFESFRSQSLDQARRGDLTMPISGTGQRGYQHGFAPPGSYMAPTAPFSQAYGNLAGGFGGAAEQMQMQRFRQFQMMDQSGGGFNVGGALGGAAAGALYGSAIPGVGTAVGAIGGGIAGLFAGGFS